uniref:Uncharacterized protein n=1 Tax=Romanomermis culicivorax TaxID=13658 RepID=A0A915ID89_ROMCU
MENRNKETAGWKHQHIGQTRMEETEICVAFTSDHTTVVTQIKRLQMYLNRAMWNLSNSITSNEYMQYTKRPRDQYFSAPGTEQPFELRIVQVDVGEKNE